MQTIDGRFPPLLPAAAMKTFQIAAPLATHWRRVRCSEYECDHYLLGWQTTVDESTELGQRQAHYIRKESGRRFTEERNEAGLTVFTFEPGQEGFPSPRDDVVTAESHGRHPVWNGRPERLIERGGDWRGNPRGELREHRRIDDWVDSFASHQDRLRALRERG